jgi:phosphoribosylanthranilate isomerase
MKIKICGMRDQENMRSVAALSPDFMGFIFYPESSRWVGEDFEITSDFPMEVKRVGVFVNATTLEIIEKVSRHRLDFVQLHGEESVEQCEELKQQGVGIIKVFSVGNDFDFKKTHPYKNDVNYFLFDTKGNKYGGNGIAFDWSILKRYDLHVPYFLSGGLNQENSRTAIEMKLQQMVGLDFNSGVEISPGIKNAGIIEKLMQDI